MPLNKETKPNQTHYSNQSDETEVTTYGFMQSNW